MVRSGGRYEVRDGERVLVDWGGVPVEEKQETQPETAPADDDYVEVEDDAVLSK
ncbi:MAG: hypothetical protein AAF358_13745 [Pseudomonadota bacterium]